MLFVGDDWAEAHHDIEIQDEQGRVLVRRRLPEGLAGMTALHGLIAQYASPAAAGEGVAGGLDGHELDGDDDVRGDVVVGIETDRGPWVQALVAAGYRVYPINPLQAARYRQRHSTSGAKSDPGDAHVLAEVVRLDAAHHRPMIGDSDLAAEVKVLARTHQSLIWSRQRTTNMLRSMLREYYPGALAAFGDDLAGRDALAVLEVAPSPAAGHRLSVARIERILRKAGRKRYVTPTATAIHHALTSEQLTAREGVVRGYAASAVALVRAVTALTAQVEDLGGQVEQCFGQHPNAQIIRSQPGLGAVLGARVLAEFGDDPHRYADAKARKNYSGMSPITRASGTKRVVLARYARNHRLADALYLQAFSALSSSPGARAYYDQHRAQGATHHAALRTLACRLVGILHGCLTHHTPYNESTAWGHRSQAAA